MIQELIFTSAPRGLQLGKSGFCTVASTVGMAGNLAKQLESLSGYRHLAPAGSAENPAVFSFLTSKVGGELFYVLSRVADAGLDYSKRSNKFAHHLATTRSEELGSGPTDLFYSDGFYTEWDKDPQSLPPRRISTQPRLVTVCQHWGAVTGDPGWAGVAAEALKEGRQVYLIVNPQQPALELVDELLRLFPPNARWQYPFTTFAANLPPNVGCQLRCLMAGSPEIAVARRSPRNLVLDLTFPLSIPSGNYVENARNGLEISMSIAAPRIPALRGSDAESTTNDISLTENERELTYDEPELFLPGPASSPNLRIRPPVQKDKWTGRERITTQANTGHERSYSVKKRIPTFLLIGIFAIIAISGVLAANYMAPWAIPLAKSTTEKPAKANTKRDLAVDQKTVADYIDENKFEELVAFVESISEPTQLIEHARERFKSKLATCTSAFEAADLTTKFANAFGGKLEQRHIDEFATQVVQRLSSQSEKKAPEIMQILNDKQIADEIKTKTKQQLFKDLQMTVSQSPSLSATLESFIAFETIYQDSEFLNVNLDIKTILDELLVNKTYSAKDIASALSKRDRCNLRHVREELQNYTIKELSKRISRLPQPDADLFLQAFIDETRKLHSGLGILDADSLRLVEAFPNQSAGSEIELLALLDKFANILPNDAKIAAEKKLLGYAGSITTSILGEVSRTSFQQLLDFSKAASNSVTFTTLISEQESKIREDFEKLVDKQFDVKALTEVSATIKKVDTAQQEVNSKLMSKIEQRIKLLGFPIGEGAWVLQNGRITRELRLRSNVDINVFKLPENSPLELRERNRNTIDVFDPKKKIVIGSIQLRDFNEDNQSFVGLQFLLTENKLNLEPAAEVVKNLDAPFLFVCDTRDGKCVGCLPMREFDVKAFKISELEELMGESKSYREIFFGNSEINLLKTTLSPGTSETQLILRFAAPADQQNGQTIVSSFLLGKDPFAKGVVSKSKEFLEEYEEQKKKEDGYKGKIKEDVDTIRSSLAALESESLSTKSAIREWWKRFLGKIDSFKPVNLFPPRDAFFSPILNFDESKFQTRLWFIVLEDAKKNETVTQVIFTPVLIGIMSVSNTPVEIRELNSIACENFRRKDSKSAENSIGGDS